MDPDNTPNGSSIYIGFLSFNSHTDSAVFIESYVINKILMLNVAFLVCSQSWHTELFSNTEGTNEMKMTKTIYSLHKC